MGNEYDFNMIRRPKEARFPILERDRPKIDNELMEFLYRGMYSTSLQGQEYPILESDLSRYGTLQY